MCLGVPGLLIDTFEEHGLRMAHVDFGGVRQRVCIEHTPGAQPGMYVLVHVGFAIALIDQHEARRVFAFVEQLGELEIDKSGKE